MASSTAAAPSADAAKAARIEKVWQLLQQEDENKPEQDPRTEDGPRSRTPERKHKPEQDPGTKVPTELEHNWQRLQLRCLVLKNTLRRQRDHLSKMLQVMKLMTKRTERVHRLVKQMKTTMEGTNRRRMRDPLHVTKVQGKLALLEQLSGLNNKDLKIKSVSEMLEIVYALSTDRVKGEAVVKVIRMEKTQHTRKMASSGAASSTEVNHDKTNPLQLM